MNRRKKIVAALLVAMAVLISTVVTACGAGPSGSGASGGTPEKIGFSFSDLSLERWPHDRDAFLQRTKELGNYQVLVQSANGSSATQVSQCENLIAQGVKVLVILAQDSNALTSVVQDAHKNGVKVIAYDRLINNAPVDFYVSFDNVQVGELQAKYITKLVPGGNFFLLEGSPTDNNAKMFEQGQKKVLDPLVKAGKIKIVGEQWANNWSTTAALNIMQNALAANNNNIQAVVDANDSTALGAIQALKAQNLAGKVPISGQDADLANCQLIVEGVQSMTVYKPLKEEAYKAADVAVDFLKGKTPQSNGTINNGMVNVPSYLLQPIAVDKNNMMDTVVKDGFHTEAQVYANIPQSQWPKQ